MHRRHDEWASWRAWNPFSRGRKNILMFRRMSLRIRRRQSVIGPPWQRRGTIFVDGCHGRGSRREVERRQSRAWLRILRFCVSCKLRLFILSWYIYWYLYRYIYKVSYSNYEAQKEAFYEIRRNTWCRFAVNRGVAWAGQTANERREWLLGTMEIAARSPTK